MSLAAVIVLSLTTQAPALSVTVTGVQGSRGHVRCLLFTRPDGFPHDAKYADARAVGAIAQGQATCLFPERPRGRFAVAVMHDENGNEALDANFLGLPTEAYGFSNDARGALGPPSFDAAATTSTAPGLTVALTK